MSWVNWAIWIVSVAAVIGYVAGMFMYPISAHDALNKTIKDEPKKASYYTHTEGQRAGFQRVHSEWEDRVTEARLHYYRRLFTCWIWPLAWLNEARAHFAEVRADMQAVQLRQSTRALKAAEKRQQELDTAKQEAQEVIDRITGGVA